jgi:amino acid permease
MEEAKKEVKPVGIIPGFIFMAILSGIVSFFTQFLLKKYFESSDNSVDDEE